MANLCIRMTGFIFPRGARNDPLIMLCSYIDEMAMLAGCRVKFSSIRWLSTLYADPPPLTEHDFSPSKRHRHGLVKHSCQQLASRRAPGTPTVHSAIRMSLRTSPLFLPSIASFSTWSELNPALATNLAALGAQCHTLARLARPRNPHATDENLVEAVLIVHLGLRADTGSRSRSSWPRLSRELKNSNDKLPSSRAGFFNMKGETLSLRK
ncbi:hypothetical protein DL93DRAFT_1085953 [Clavulina sp. PMI_390]|nr:hypothetical protein DL93DRAFT_1085953 [Clavulina sp. PMI_390]